MYFGHVVFQCFMLMETEITFRAVEISDVQMILHVKCKLEWKDKKHIKMELIQHIFNWPEQSDSKLFPSLTPLRPTSQWSSKPVEHSSSALRDFFCVAQKWSNFTQGGLMGPYAHKKNYCRAPDRALN